MGIVELTDAVVNPEVHVSLPEFFVIGAPKAGSTALHAALARHPQLWMSEVKEPKYFLCDDRPPEREHGPGDAHSQQEWIWRRDAYEALFAGAPEGALRGESTPFYLSDRAAQRRIHEAVPDAKLVAILRDPVDRAYSNWAHLWADGLEPLGDFMAACGAEERRAEEGWARFWRYQQLGRYGEQLEHLFTVFPREQVHILRYRDLVDDPRATIDRICDFLGVETGVVDEVPSENVSTYVDPKVSVRVLQALLRGGAAVGKHFPPQVWRTASVPLLRALRGRQRNRPELGTADRLALVEVFADDVRLLEQVTGESYSDWLSDQGRGTYSVRRSCAPSDRVDSQ